jgi:hypothetical protein
VRTKSVDHTHFLIIIKAAKKIEMNAQVE